MRALAIALFYALGTCIGGLGAPALFGRLLEAGLFPLALGYCIGAILMLVAAVTEWRLGVDSEQKGLEDVTTPFSAEDPPS
jgi:hypothetical protein